VFCVLLIVNFVVINKGATRMAEVGARFALDAMPGKQLAIDADVAAGAIDHAEAKARRKLEQDETTFFGSLDGASKFVKGDAIAGLLITGLNLVVGLVIGTVVHDMPIGQAFETYSILTVGDGLVSQVPAVVIAIASALLLARGGATGATDTALGAQLGRYPAALATVAVLMGLFALVPGLPFLPFMAGALALGACAYLVAKSRAETTSPEADAQGRETTEPPRPLGDLLDLDDIHVEFAPDLVEMVLDPATGLDARITNMRRHVALTYGLLLSEIRMTDNPGLPHATYTIKIHGVEQARATLRFDCVLALLPGHEHEVPPGEDIKEPVYGAPARWIAAADQEAAQLSGITTVQPPEVLATHLLEIIRRNLARLMTNKALRRILDEMVNLTDRARSEANRRLLDDLVPDRVPQDVLLAVLRLLLEEQVSIRNLPLILDAMSEARTVQTTVEAITEHVRQRIGFQLVAGLKRPDGTIPLIQLAPEWEDLFVTYQMGGDRGSGDIALPPDEFNRLAAAIAEKVDTVAAKGTHAALVTPMRRRRFLRTILVAKGIANPVLSFEEIGLEARPALVGMVAA
jgi:flagellar biosynthesis protein FlhA